MVTVAARDASDRCPGALHAVAAGDGLLLRVRTPGGYLSANGLEALATIAERDGNGTIDITARANAQLRGLRADRLAAAAATLEAAGLLPSRTHERVRNIAANPFAGLDPAELVDVRPLAAALDRALLADPRLAALPAKMLFALDGGGRGAATDGADIAARATMSGEALRFTVTCGDAAPVDAAVSEVVHVAIRFALHVLARGRRIADTGYESRGAGRGGKPVAASSRTHPAGGTAALAGTLPGIYDGAEPDQVALVPSVPLGRLRAAQAHALAAFGRVHEADVRFAPWRGLVVGPVARASAPEARAFFADLGLPLDERDGFAGVAACAGARACTASLADVRADAAAYAATIAATPHDARVAFALDIAGCAKRCAMRHDADATLVPDGGGYDVFLHGTHVAHERTSSAALARVIGARGTA